MALQTFGSFAEAHEKGFEFYDRSPVVYIVRKKTASGWKLAIVQLRLQPEPKPS